MFSFKSASNAPPVNAKLKHGFIKGDLGLKD